PAYAGGILAQNTGRRIEDGGTANGEIEIRNCYNAGEVTITAGSGTYNYAGGIVPSQLIFPAYTDTKAGVHQYFGGSVVNSYDGGSVTVAQLGSAFKDDENRINGGYPLLAWQSETVADAQYAVTFKTTPADPAATVRVYADSLRTNEILAQNGAYSLRNGQYYYSVEAAGRVTEYGSFSVAYMPKTVSVALKPAAAVAFDLNPPDASLILTDSSGRTVDPVSREDGKLSYVLYADALYVYTASAEGRNGVLREFAAEDGLRIAVALTPSEQGDVTGTITGGQTINAGGVYNLTRKSGTQGTITINTTDPVTLVGTGLSLADMYENLYIDCAVEGVTLTLRDLFVSNTVGSANMINFRGENNLLLFKGTSILDMNTGASGYAMIHVPAGVELTLGGVTDEDALYFYKREQGAGIGGNGDASGAAGQTPEYNGKITITGGKLFMKNSKQGALIGSGADSGDVTGSPGDVTIQGGELNLVAISRGAAIGGSAGGSGGAKGADVHMYGGTLNINADWSGAAIGGGGYGSGNDASGGTFHYHAGSIRVFVDENAISQWGVSAPGVNDVAITARKQDGAGNPVYSFVFDTRRLSVPADDFTVTADGADAPIYEGGLHRWHYVNEVYEKGVQMPINYTMDNWVPLDDPHLYLYLTGENHTLSVNGEVFSLTWDGVAKRFSVYGGERYNVSIDENVTGGAIAASPLSAAAGEFVGVSLSAADGYRYVADSLKYNETLIATGGALGFTMPAENVTLTAAFEPIPPEAQRYAIVSAGVYGGVIAADRAEAATGETITVTATPHTGYGLVQGSLKANGVSVQNVDGAYRFLMPDGPVTLTAEFASVAAETPNGALFKTGATQDYVVVIEKDISLYDAAAGPALNGVLLPSGAYEVKEGSTRVTLFAAYLDTLPQGNYALGVTFTDGTVVERSFAIDDNPTYKIEAAPLSGGSLTPDRTEAHAGDLITVTVTAHSGYRFVPGSLNRDGRAINADAEGKYAFEMPAWDVTLTADFIEVETTAPPVQGADEEAFKEGIKGSGDISAWVWDGKS
ncbi:MAG: hypothetical protein LBD95_04710, partial [Clostridiales Family XIII bacterium]|nr:hypothetical protein [Clostridiales Family XIII bacterium]